MKKKDSIVLERTAIHLIGLIIDMNDYYVLPLTKSNCDILLKKFDNIKFIKFDLEHERMFESEDIAASIRMFEDDYFITEINLFANDLYYNYSVRKNVRLYEMSWKYYDRVYPSVVMIEKNSDEIFVLYTIENGKLSKLDTSFRLHTLIYNLKINMYKLMFKLNDK